MPFGPTSKREEWDVTRLALEGYGIGSGYSVKRKLRPPASRSYVDRLQEVLAVEKPKVVQDPRAVLRAMTSEEEAHFRPLSDEEIEAALAQGRTDRLAAERSATQPSVNSSMLFR